MGCSSSHVETIKTNSNKEEEIICSWEKYLNYYTLQDIGFLKVIDSQQDEDGFIPIKSLWDIFYFCNFPPHSYPVNTGPVSIFYKTIRKDDKINAQKLMALIILTSSFEHKTKAQLIYKIYRDTKDFIKEKSLERLFIDISNISINLIWVALGKQPNQICKDVLMKYESKLEQGQHNFVEKQKNLIINTDGFTTEKTFINRIEKFPKLLSAPGIRECILRENKESSLLGRSKPYIRLMSIKTSDTLGEAAEDERGRKKLNFDFGIRTISKTPSKNSQFSSKIDESYLKNSMMMKKIVESYLSNLRAAVNMWRG
ncbi:unnamed protein product [Blepharisma stoltei]|uniref:Uncharacterized protein n=1 Tax=Blepharisma stoltei TaxID=1481888 RepID=A0AAU9IYV4_9CILI|nr:unnamed protein product [Blepharisma stoltei]